MNNTASKITIPPAAIPLKPSCGLETQLNICIGNTVNLSIGPEGTNVRYTNALMAIIGADSPIALDIAKIVPVNIPGNAEGNITLLTTSHLVAPKANAASR